MQSFDDVLAKIEELKISTGKAFNKGNKAQAKKARKQTVQLRALINALRSDLLAVYKPAQQ